jgi:hypothetical protein
MMLNVLSWKEALKQGFEPRLYSYATGDIPLGNVEAVLDFKVWAQKVMGIGCYFTELQTGRKFILTVYCQPSGVYRQSSHPTDFSSCPIATVYRLFISLHKSGRIIFSLQKD